MTIEIRPSDAVIGAHVIGLDLGTPPTPEEVEAVEVALERFGVLVFADQHISPAEQIAFSRAFAELELTARVAARLDGHPEIFVVGNTGPEMVSFAPADGSTELEWHADHMHLNVPARASLLYCLETPPDEGDTLFACMYGAYESLSDNDKADADQLTAHHSVSGLRAYLRDKGHAETAEQTYDRDDVTVSWPLVREHPATGRRSLYFGTGVTIGIDGWANEQARAYLSTLGARAAAPELQWRHRWSVGDAVLWDNRRVLHAGTPFDSGRHRRCMHRTTWREDRPIVGPATRGR